MKNFSWRSAAAAAVCVVAISGCDGKSGRSGEGDLAPVELGVSGSAFKGVIRNGNVEACELTSAGVLTSRCATGTTNDSGRYSLSIADYAGGPVRVTVSGGQGATTLCDAADGCGGVDFGDPIDIGAGFSIRTELPGITGDTVNAPVTPFTDLVAELASQGSGSYRDRILAAASQISALLGNVDVLSVEPVDVTDLDNLVGIGGEANDYSLFVSAVASLAGNPADAMATLRLFFSSGVISGTDYGTLTTAARRQSDELNIPEQLGLISVAEINVAQIPPGGTFSPRPIAGADDVQAAKNTVAALRGLVDRASQLESPLGLAEQELSDISDSLDRIDPMLVVLAEALDELIDSAGDLIDSDGCQTSSITVRGLTAACSESDGLVSITVNGTPTAQMILKSAAPAEAVLTNLVLTVSSELLELLDPDFDPESVDQGTLELGISLESLTSVADSGAQLSLSIESGRVAVTLKEDFDVADAEADLGSELDRAADSLTFDFQATFAATDINLDSDSTSITGEFRITVSNPGCDGRDECEVAFQLDRLRFSGELTANDAELALSLEYTPLASGEPLRFFGGPRPEDDLFEIFGNLVLTLDLTGLDTDVPAPRMQISVRAEENQHEDDGGVTVAGEASLYFQLGGPGESIRITARNTLDAADEAVITIRADNSTALELTFDTNEFNFDTAAGVIRRGGDQVATVSRGSGGVLLIRYADGSFESLF